MYDSIRKDEGVGDLDLMIQNLLGNIFGLWNKTWAELGKPLVNHICAEILSCFSRTPVLGYQQPESSRMSTP